MLVGALEVGKRFLHARRVAAHKGEDHAGAQRGVKRCCLRLLCRCERVGEGRGGEEVKSLQWVSRLKLEILVPKVGYFSTCYSGRRKTGSCSKRLTHQVADSINFGDGRARTCEHSGSEGSKLGGGGGSGVVEGRRREVRVQGVAH